MILELTRENLERYLGELAGRPVNLVKTGQIGEPTEQAMKEFGYGKALEVIYELDGREERAVLSVMRGDRYGHQFYWDRAAILLFEHYAGSRMEKHVRPLGVGYVDKNGRLIPIHNPQEFFIVHEKIEGVPYFAHLERICQHGIENSDIERVREFARWLARIHSQKKSDADIYLRRIRQLIGASECIWGIIDAYPFPYNGFPPEAFMALEKRLIEWRWKLRRYTNRLATTHGDFHPWNVMIRPDGEFVLLDRSRGEWGEPADDIACMSANYLLYGLYQNPSFSGDFERLYRELWETYLQATGDREILEVIAPFYVFRGLVMASPQWYPNHPEPVRRALLRLVATVLDEERFDYSNINKYIRE